MKGEGECLLHTVLHASLIFLGGRVLYDCLAACILTVDSASVL